MILSRVTTRRGVDQTGIEEAREELGKARQDVAEIHALGEQMSHLATRAREIRSQNGFAELMDQLVVKSQGRNHRHHAHGSGG